MFLWAAMAWAGWSVGPEARVAEGVVVASALGAPVLDAGWLFDVRDEDDALRGVVFVGNGRWRVPVADPITGLATANLLAVVGGAERDAVAPLVEQGALDTSVDVAWFLGPEGCALREGALRVREDAGVVVTEGRDGRTEIVVTASVPLRVARRRAEQLLRDRVAHHSALGTDLEALVAVLERQARGGSRASVPLWGELKTGTDWGALVDAPRQPWLTATRQRGRVAGAGAALAVEPLTAEGGEPWVLATEEEAHPQVAVRGAAATVELTPDGPEQSAWQRHGVVLEVEATGSVGVVELSIPRASTAAFGGFPELESGFELGVVTVDGSSVTPWRVHDDATRSVIAVPVSLDAGQRAQIVLRWLDRQRYAHAIEVGVGGPVGSNAQLQPVGTTTDLVEVFPRLLGPRPRPLAVPARLTVGVPTARPAHRAVGSGAEVLEVLRDGWRWTTTDSSFPSAGAVLGRWPERSKEGHEREEARLYLRTEVDAEVTPVADRLARLQRGAFGLPERPAPTVVELHAAVGRFGASLASEGMIAFEPYAAPPFHLEGAEPFAAVADSVSTWVLAYGLFGLPSSSGADGSGPEAALSMAAATLTVQGASGAQVAAPWWRLLHLTAAPRRGYGLGVEGQAFGVGRSLPTLVGHAAVAEAMGQVARGEQEASWQGLAEALEGGTGVDLDGVVAVHLVAGLAPRVRARVDGDQVVVTTNIPFGVLYLPIRVGRGEEAIAGLVRVEDGTGTATIPWEGSSGPPRRVVVDPDRAWLLQRPEVSLWEEGDEVLQLTGGTFAPRQAEGASSAAAAERRGVRLPTGATPQGERPGVWGPAR